MSLDDGLVMQIHPGSFRNHNAALFAAFGRDVGADIPTRTDYVHALKPLLDRFGNETRLTIILFTLDETAYGRNSRRSPGTTRRFALGRPGGSSIRRRACAASREIATETAGFAQYGRLQRRYAGVHLDPGPPRRRPPGGLRLPRRTGGDAPAGRGRGVRGSPRLGLRAGQARLPAVRVQKPNRLKLPALVRCTHHGKNVLHCGKRSPALRNPACPERVAAFMFASEAS